MPCTITGSIEGDRALALQEQLSEATRTTQLLCRTLTVLPPEVVDTLPPEVKAWWEHHQEVDRARVESERRLAKAREEQDRRAYERLKAKFEQPGETP